MIRSTLLITHTCSNKRITRPSNTQDISITSQSDLRPPHTTHNTSCDNSTDSSSDANTPSSCRCPPFTTCKHPLPPPTFQAKTLRPAGSTADSAAYCRLSVSPSSFEVEVDLPGEKCGAASDCSLDESKNEIKKRERGKAAAHLH